MASHTEENYLKALFHLSKNGEKVGVSDLARRLDVKSPTANSMVKRLGQQGLVKYEKYQPLVLTEKGRKQAALIIRKHRLTEMFLVEKMGFGWEEVHDIAEQMEHIKAPEFFDRMDELMGFPSVDPHGAPIPDKDGHVQWKTFHKLSDCDVKSKVVLSAITSESQDFLKFLNTKDLHLGLEITIHEVEPFDGSMTISYKGHKNESFSQKVCERLLVERE